MKIELFCEDCPKTCENFLALCASDYYNNSLFHRNIKGFIVQTGDPTGSGKGGSSIWGRKFEDEFKDNLKHTDRGMISMANSGPNTNASQFFFTYAAQPHLDLKYTLFGKKTNSNQLRKSNYWTSVCSIHRPRDWRIRCIGWAGEIAGEP